MKKQHFGILRVTRNICMVGVLAIILSSNNLKAAENIAICLEKKAPLLVPEQFVANYSAKTQETYCPNGKESKCITFTYRPKFKVVQKNDSSGELLLVLKGRKFEVTVTGTKLIATRENKSAKYELTLEPRVSDLCNSFTGQHRMTYKRVSTLSDGRRIIRFQEGLANDDLMRMMK